MGKASGFLEYKRQSFIYGKPQKRVKNYKEFMRPVNPDMLSEQGARCMDCGTPFCHSEFGCPVMNLIPEWNDLVYRRHWKEAYERLAMTNNFPEFTGRVCPAPCETACTLSINDSPVTIKQIELAIIERAFAENWVKPQPPRKESGKKVAVVGSGPAGLAAAQQLRRNGHQVFVYEKSPRPGGLLRYGIPDFKLEKCIIDRRLRILEAEGVQFICGVEVGEDISARYLRKNHDAILITTGAGEARDLKVPGRELKGIHLALEYLTQSNLYVEGSLNKEEIIWAEGKKVLVIGGGDTGSDCIGTAHRQGAKEIYQFEIMPMPPRWDKSRNPQWPFWPNILRTSSSQEEGCERKWNVSTEAFSGKNGYVQKARCRRVKWQPGENGKKPCPQPLEGSEFEVETDLVLLAMGFVHVKYDRFIRHLNIERTPIGNIKTDEMHRTSLEDVFAVGDAASGASLVVRAIQGGREAAEAVHAYLS